MREKCIQGSDNSASQEAEFPVAPPNDIRIVANITAV